MIFDVFLLLWLLVYVESIEYSFEFDFFKTSKLPVGLDSLYVTSNRLS